MTDSNLIDLHNPRAPGLSVHRSIHLQTLYLPLFSHGWTSISQVNADFCRLMSLLLLLTSYILIYFRAKYKFLLYYPNNWIVFRTQITQIQGIISLALGIGICEIPDIWVIFFEHRKHEKTRNISLALGMSIWETAIFFRTQITQIEEIFSQGSTSYASVSLALGINIYEIPDICGCLFLNTDCTDLRDYLAYVWD